MVGTGLGAGGTKGGVKPNPGGDGSAVGAGDGDGNGGGLNGEVKGDRPGFDIMPAFRPVGMAIRVVLLVLKMLVLLDLSLESACLKTRNACAFLSGKHVHNDITSDKATNSETKPDLLLEQKAG